MFRVLDVAAAVPTTPLDPAPSSTARPEAGSRALAAVAGVEVGVWEMSPGTATDVEVDEVFVVLSGSATVTFEDGEEVDARPRASSSASAPASRPPGSSTRPSARSTSPDHRARGIPDDRDDPQLHRRRARRVRDHRLHRPRRPGHRGGRRPLAGLDCPRRSTGRTPPPSARRRRGSGSPRAVARPTCSTSPPRWPSGATRSARSRPATPASRCATSPARRSTRASTSCASSPVPRGCSRASRRGSTSRATPRASAASRSASSAR